MKISQHQREARRDYLVHVFKISCFVLLMMSSQCVWSQGWVIDGWVDINHNDCAVEEIVSGSVTVGGMMLPEISSEGSRKYFRLTMPDDIDPSGSLIATATGNCVAGYPCFTPETPELCPSMPSATFGAAYTGAVLMDRNSTDCISFVFSSNAAVSAQVLGGISFYPRLKINKYVPSIDCSGETVTASDNCFGSLVWEYSNQKNGEYHLISDKTSQSIFITAADVYWPGYDRYGTRWMRISDPEKTGRTSDPIGVEIRVPPPTVVVNATSPTCHDGPSSIVVTINHPDAAFQNQFIVKLYDIVNENQEEQVNVNGFTHTFSGQYYSHYIVHVDNDTNVPSSCGVDSNDVSGIINPPAITVDFSVPPLDRHGHYVSCSEGNDGELTVIPSGGTQSFMGYSWKKNNEEYLPGNESASIANLSVGNYTVNFTDTNGCPANNDSTPVIISAPEPITIGFLTSDRNGFAISCHSGPDSSNGTISAIPAGGVGGFHSYWWENEDEELLTIQNLSEGTYRVHVKDANGCDASATKEIFAPDPISVSITPLLQFRGFAVSCSNVSDGEISAVALGGVGGFAYSWSPDENEATVMNKSADIEYTVVVRDLNSCTAAESVTLTPPPLIDFAINLVKPVSCFGEDDAELEVIDITNADGSPGYSWSADTNMHEGFLSGQSASVGTVTVIDQLSCETTKSYEIFNPPIFTASINPLSNFNGSFIQCNGDNNGEIAATLFTDLGVATAGEYFVWYKDGILFDQSASLNSINQLTEGQYKVEIKYREYCTAVQEFTLHDPDPIDVAINITSDYHGQPISCAGAADASLMVTALGGTGPFVYHWQNPNHDGPSFDNLGAGLYAAFAKDANDCEGTKTITLVDPLPVRASVVASSEYTGFGVSCFGVADGSISVAGSGGTGMYDFLWQDNQTLRLRNNLGSGTYSITVMDSNGCADDVEHTLVTPTPVSLDVQSQINVSCQGGTDGEIVLIASGGAGQYEYSVNNGTDWQHETAFSSLAAGSFSFMMRDINHCMQTTSSILAEPDVLQVSFTDISPAFCTNPIGTAKAVGRGGVANYNYQWYDASMELIGFQSTLSNASAGIYTVTLEDAHHCIATDQVSITSTDGARATWSEEPATCFDSNDGSALIIIASGEGPFTVVWPDGQRQLQGVGLKKGSFFVEITDSHDCRTVETINITAPDQIVMSVKSKTDPSCYGYADGEIELEASGGMGEYSFVWNGKTTNAQHELKAGVYSIEVKDSNQCILNQTIELLQPEPLNVQTANLKMATCTNGCDGALQVSVDGGNGDYQYAWSNGALSNRAVNICPGDYSITITDGKGCTVNKALTLANTPQQPLDLGGGVTLCVGQTYVLDAGIAWKSYLWKGARGFVSDQQSVMVKEPGSYLLEATTKDGCVVRDTFLLETSLDLLKASFLLPHEAIAGDTVVFIDISWPVPETISWAFPAAMQKIYDVNEIVLGQFNQEGVYDIGLTANLGECRDYISKSITILAGAETEIPGGRLGYEAYVKDFTMYPNPTDGNFEVGVELLEVAPITLSIWNSATGVMMKRVSFKGSSLYTIPFDLRPLGFGTYVIRLDHEQGKEYLRFVVH